MKKVREGYKSTELGVIPVEWIIKKFGDVFERITDKNKGNESNNVLTISAQMGLVNQEEFFNKNIASKNTGNYYLLKKGDFAYNKSYSAGYPMGAIKRLNNYEKGIVSPLYICFRKKYELVNSKFYEHFFEHTIFDNAIASIAQEGARNHGLLNVSVSDFFNLPIIFPPIEEQKKIASILSTVDEQIDNVDGLIQKNKELKKGLMHQLLTKGIGHTKFKKTEIGEIPEDWEVKNLGEICEFRQGFQIPRSEQILNEKDGYIRYLYITDFFSDSNKLYIKDSDKYYYIGTKDIAIANTGNTCGKAFRGAMGVLSNNMFKIFNDKNIISDNYLWHYLNSDYYWNELSKYFNTAGQPHVGHKNMSQLKVAIPKQLIEQERIALILSEFDEKIEEYENKKQNLEELKKGLMQQLLTGKIRIY